MKIGSENRTKLITATVLMVLALAMGGRLLFDSPATPSPALRAADPPASIATVPTASPRSKPGLKKPERATRSLDPTLRYDWLRASEGTEYRGTGRNIFRADAEIPAIVTPPATDKTVAVDTGPPPPPPPPPINLKFYGFASKPGESKKIFLSQGEDVFIAAEGDIVDRRYRVLRISPVAVEVEDVLNNNRQSLPLAQQGS